MWTTSATVWPFPNLLNIAPSIKSESQTCLSHVSARSPLERISHSSYHLLLRLTRCWKLHQIITSLRDRCSAKKAKRTTMILEWDLQCITKSSKKINPTRMSLLAFLDSVLKMWNRQRSSRWKEDVRTLIIASLQSRQRAQLLITEVEMPHKRCTRWLLRRHIINRLCLILE